MHGEACHTRAIMREAGLSFTPLDGEAWHAADGVLSRDRRATPHAQEFRQALIALQDDLPVTEFLARHFGDPHYADLRRSITRMVEGYDAADPSRASTFALRDEWMERGVSSQEGGSPKAFTRALIAFLLAESSPARCVVVHFGAVVNAIDGDRGTVTVCCADGRSFASGFTPF